MGKSFGVTYALVGECLWGRERSFGIEMHSPCSESIAVPRKGSFRLVYGGTVERIWRWG